MVGVPGRSKACKTCKKRKIACTLERPSCKICIKSNRECLGYEQDRTFILDQRTRKQLLKVESKEVTPVTPRTSRASPDKSTSPADPTQPFTEIQGTISTKNAYSSLWNLTCPSVRSIYRQQIICEFLHTFRPDGAVDAAPERYKYTKSWLSLLPNHPDFTTALEATVLAICTAKLGRANNDDALVHESLKFYIQGLWELQKALYDPELMYKEETAGSCMALVAYEIMECPDRTTKAWKKHMNGCTKLFELRGPKAYSSEFGHELFLGFRQMEIQQAIIEKRKTFLSEPEWNEHPWKGYTKSLSHQLLDIQAEMASALSTGHALLSAPGSMENPLALLPQILALVKDCWKLDTRLNAFYKRLQKSIAGPVYWARLSNGFNQSILTGETGNEIGEGNLGTVFPVSYQFHDLDTARTVCHYWASLCILWSGMKFIYSLLGPIAPLLPFIAPGSSLPSLEHRSDVGTVAKNICQSCEYIISYSSGTLAMLVVFPLKVAMEAMADPENGCERELEWAKGVMIRVGVGVQLLNNLGEPVESHSYLPTPDGGTSSIEKNTATV